MENFENQARGLSCLELEASVEANTVMHGTNKSRVTKRKRHKYSKIPVARNAFSLKSWKENVSTTVLVKVVA